MSNVEIIKLPRFASGEAIDTPPLAEILPPNPEKQKPKKQENKQDINQDLAVEQPTTKQPSPVDTKYLSHQIIDNPVIDHVVDPNNQEYTRCLAYYKNVCLQYPYLREVYKEKDIKGKKYDEVVTEIRMQISMRTSDVLLMMGFRTVNGFVEQMACKNGVDISGYTDTITQNPEVRELLMLIRLKHQDKLVELGPEEKLGLACLMTAITCFSLNQSKKPVAVQEKKTVQPKLPEKTNETPAQNPAKEQIKNSFMATFMKKDDKKDEKEKIEQTSAAIPKINVNNPSGSMTLPTSFSL